MDDREEMGYIKEIRSFVGRRPLILAGALVLVFDEQDRLLLQHRTDENMWDLPGGFTEIGERVEDTARREVQEETGLEIGDMTLFNVFSGNEFYYECPNGDQVYPISVVYVTNEVTGNLSPDGNEVSDVKYFPVDDLPSDLYPEIRGIIESYLKSHGMKNNFSMVKNEPGT